MTCRSNFTVRETDAAVLSENELVPRAVSVYKSPILCADVKLTMDGPDETNQTDVLLLPFVRSGDEESEAYLSKLISEQTESTIKGIIQSKLRVSLSSADGGYNNQEALDLLAEVQTALLASLRELKNEAHPRIIGNLHRYVAAVTFNACHQLLRRKYPKRLQLKNKLRYLLTHVPDFDLWETDDREWLCGFASWRAAQFASGIPAQIQLVRDSRQKSNNSVESGRGREAFIELLTSIFHSLKKPALLEEVVSLVADSLGIKEDLAYSDQVDDQKATELRTDMKAQAIILTELEQRAHLQKLWSEICQLPFRHRAALLLNLRDKRGADTLALLPLTRVATISEISDVLGFGPEQFASIWNDLPWDDARIAEHLGLRRQQVINLRQSARNRLARNVKGF